MFLESRFYKSMDNEEKIEFREYRSTLTFIFLFDLACFLAASGLVYLYLEKTPATIAMAACIGVWALLDGLLPLLVQRRIVIDRKSKTLFYTGGAARFFFKTLNIPISDISNVVIKETAESALRQKRGSSGKDIIYLAIRGRNDLKIDAAMDEFYLNDFAYELSEKIGCRVVTQRF